MKTIYLLLALFLIPAVGWGDIIEYTCKNKKDKFDLVVEKNDWDIKLTSKDKWGNENKFVEAPSAEFEQPKDDKALCSRDNITYIGANDEEMFKLGWVKDAQGWYCPQDDNISSSAPSKSVFVNGETVQDDKTYFSKVTCIYGCDNDKAEEITLSNIQVHATDEAVKESKSQEWREKCDFWLDSLNKATRDKEVSLYANIATAYCIRALLEEIRK